MNDITSPLRLSTGSHQAGSGQGCAMNVISWENGDTTITDYPACAARPLARMVQNVNDSICTHRSGDFLCPACSIRVLDLAHRTVGTSSATPAQQAAWFAELLDSSWGVARFTEPGSVAYSAIVRVAALYRRLADGQKVGQNEWWSARNAAAAYANAATHAAAFAATNAAANAAYANAAANANAATHAAAAAAPAYANAAANAAANANAATNAAAAADAADAAANAAYANADAYAANAAYANADAYAADAANAADADAADAADAAEAAAKYDFTSLAITAWERITNTIAPEQPASAVESAINKMLLKI